MKSIINTTGRNFKVTGAADTETTDSNIDLIMIAVVNAVLLIFLPLQQTSHNWLNYNQENRTCDRVSLDFPTVIDKEEAKNLTEFIANPMAKDLIQTYLTYCTENEICLGNNIQRRSRLKHACSCCQPCSCEDNCHDKQICCPSLFLSLTEIPAGLKIPSFLNSTRPLSPKRCKRPQARYTNAMKANVKTAFWMIDSCPSGYKNRSVELKCKEVKAYIDIYSIDSYRSVTSLQSNITYKNHMCAICHGELDINLIPWIPYLICTNYKQFIPRLIKDIISDVFDNNVCNIAFRPPESLARGVLEQCDHTVIGDCNVTGYWSTYDPRVALGCYSFTSVYMERFKNIFCYICNAPTGHTAYHVCNSRIANGHKPVHPWLSVDDFPSFSSLLDFNMDENLLQDKSPTTAHQCSGNQIKDFVENSCKNITCGFDQLYGGEGCLNFFGKFSVRNYELNIQVIPLYKDNTFDQTFAKNYFEFLHHVFQTSEVCQILSFFEPSGEAQNDDFDKSQSLFFHVRVNVNRSHFINEFVRSTIDLIDLQSSNYSVGNNFSEKIKSYQIVILGQEIHALDLFSSSSVFSFNLFFNPQNMRKLSPFVEFMYNRKRPPNVPFRDFYCSTPHIETLIADISVCPKVSINTTQLHLYISIDNSLCFVDFRFCIQSRFFKRGEKALFYDICLEQYSQLVKQKSDVTVYDLSSESDLSFLSSSVSILCLSVTLITYLLFPSLRTLPGKNIMGLSFMLLLANVTYVCSNWVVVSRHICYVIGMMNHYFWLSSVSWMFVSCLHMLRVFGSLIHLSEKSKKLSFIFYCAVSQVFPIIPILVNVLISLSEYNGIGYGGKWCYISSKYMILFTFALPIFVAVAANFIFLIIVVYRISSNSKLIKSQDRKHPEIFIKLSTLTGFTWIFAFIYQFTGVDIFSYLNIVFNAGQGIVIFLAFVCNHRVAKLYALLLGCRKT